MNLILVPSSSLILLILNTSLERIQMTLSLNRMMLHSIDNLFRIPNSHYLSRLNQPCRHLGTGPGVSKVALAISVNVTASKINRLIRFSFSAQTSELIITPSSSF